MMTQANLNQLLKVGAIALPLAASACVTTGTASGQLKEPAGKQEAVTLVWKSDATAPDRGKISGTLPDGKRYSGRYFEVIKSANAEVYGLAWEGWRPYWAGWRTPWYEPIGDLDWSGFVDVYTGRVIANLKTDSGARMRCRFTIEKPEQGLVGGGTGECQLSNGEAIDHVVLAAT